MTLAFERPPAATSHNKLEWPDFVVRVTGLPVHHAWRLRFEQTAALIDEWLALDRALASEATGISDELFEHIGRLEEITVRGPLIALRRAVFNQQAPKHLETAATLLPSLLIRRIRTFEELRQRRMEISNQGQNTLETEWAQLRQHLRDSAGHPEFQRGLLLSSFDLYTETQQWLAQPASTARRKLELSLAQYILRASTKTSPFSTFTSLARGRWRSSQNTRIDSARDWTRIGYGELSRSIANQLMQTFAGWPSVRDNLKLSLNPSLKREGEAWTFLAWRKGEKHSSLKHQPTLGRLFDATTGPEMTYGRALNVILDEPVQESEARTMLDRLIAFGALELHFPQPERDLDHFEALCAAAAPVEREDPDAWRNLQALRDGLRQFEYVPANAKRKADQALRQLCASPVLSERGLTMPTRNTIFEDTLIPDLDYGLEPQSWLETKADLERVTKLYALRDSSWAIKQRALALFKSTYPKGKATLLEFYQHFHADSTQDIQHLDPTRALLQEVQQYALERQGELERSWIDTFFIRFPQVLRGSRTIAYYAQPLADQAGLVINTWQAGAGRAQARLRRFERKLGVALPEMARASDPKRIPVDLGGVFGTNVNLREPLTELEIPYPGYHSDRPEAQLLRLRDLQVHLNADRSNLELVAPHLDAPLEPIHTGLLGQRWLPPLFEFLVHAFGVGPIDPTPSRLRSYNPPSTQNVIFEPRLTLGCVIIERARWTLPQAALPTQKPGEPLFHTLKKLAEWRAKHSIPDTVFLQKIGSSSSKPAFIDFRSAFGLELMQRQIGQDDGTLIMHEVLPALGAAAVEHRDGSFVHELVFECQIQRWST